MPPPPQTVQGQGVKEKMLMGAMMGTGVGLTIGLIFGMTSIVRAGPGPRGTVATLAQYMTTSAATFGFFMSIGSVIRTDSPYRLPETPAPLSPFAAFRRPRWEIEIKEKRVKW